MLESMFSSLNKTAVSHSAAFFEQLLNNSRNLVFVKDRALNIIYGNQAFLNLYPPELRASVIGTHSGRNFDSVEYEVFSAEDRKALERGFSEIVEEITDYKGRVRTLQTQKTRITDEQGQNYVLGVSVDITQQAARERALAASNLALENFAAVAAHDLRSPLASLASSLDLIGNDEQSQLSVTAKKHMDLMVTCIDGLIEQISALLSANKIDCDTNGARSECDLSILFEEVRFGLSARIQSEKAKVLSSALPVLTVNKPMFRQLVHNLIENSLKYRSESSPVIILRYVQENNLHVFSIEDNGRGVEPAWREKVFGMYEQTDARNEGYGIGLSLCRRIVDMHGGKIWLDEGFAPGCRICFSLPV